MPGHARPRRALLLAAVVVAMAGLAGCAEPTPIGSGSPAGGPGSQAVPADAETYCTDQGGQLVDRAATWDTNADPSAWLALAGRWTLCEFESGEGDEATRISVDLTTLASEQPTLAAIAYLSEVRTTSPPVVGQNPAQYSCATDLGGASSFGNTAAGGGWVDPDQPVFVVMNLCVFADGSAIDAFGLWYHANGTIRGADLAPLLRYQPGDELPALYAPTRP